jgi:hypothetical protein
VSYSITIPCVCGVRIEAALFANHAKHCEKLKNPPPRIERREDDDTEDAMTPYRRRMLAQKERIERARKDLSGEGQR